MFLALFDSHSHLDAPEFDGDRAAVMQRARDAGVAEQLVPAVDHDSWPKLREVCAADPGLHPAYGLHPMYLDRHRPEHLPALREWIERERPRAIGECGLDFFVDGLDPEQQRFYLRKQLELAREFDLPVVLHARRAVEEITAMLRGIGGLRGVIHSYSGSEEQARQLFGLGFMLGIGGPLTYDRAKRLHRLVADMPIEFLLLETDSPDQPGSMHRGQRNEPAHLQFVLETVARLRGADPDEIASATRANARRLLRL
ncbi:MAG: DNAase [Gammaproteobacteria bacterium RIFCSPHIGHO2_12_FULL_63_22]|nr:MAG: DNAase [Gammaproteobacteria bacterium RIFCSPHIGHO2_12_FULL_63_22]